MSIDTLQLEATCNEENCEKRSQEAEEALLGCFEATNWDALCQPHEDINAITESLTNIHISVWTTQNRMKITGFKQKEDEIDGSLDN
ncbi:hypothetical protein ATANTOWER_012807 [Ataeniobius toweri]|uniref:Uncharacterized protein n=1 Tax=Ataeniobius toweri TaxID=208326 RepID=A0ABU7CAM5_9TELE|nr:hypothetical protein [Ataeniobius toweri]